MHKAFRLQGEKWLGPVLSSFDTQTGAWFLFLLITQGHMGLCPSQPDGGPHPVASSLSTDPKEKAWERSMVFTIKMHQPPFADYIFGGEMVVTWSNINPGWPSQAFRLSPVMSLRVFLSSTHLGGRRSLLTATEDLGCVTTLPGPLSLLSLAF